MTDEFMERFRRASRDPVIVATKAGLFLVDLLLFGSPAHRAWNALCAVQAARYRQILTP